MKVMISIEKEQVKHMIFRIDDKETKRHCVIKLVLPAEEAPYILNLSYIRNRKGIFRLLLGGLGP